MLQERPLECGVIPGFRVADEAQADMLFAEAWDEWLAERLLGGDEMLVEALDAGIPLEGESQWGERSSLRGFARTLLEQRDLAAARRRDSRRSEAWRERAPGAGRSRAVSSRPRPRTATRSPRASRRWRSSPKPRRFLEGEHWPATSRGLEPIPKNFGHKPRWPSAEALDEAREIAAWTKRRATPGPRARRSSLHGRLVRALAGRDGPLRAEEGRARACWTSWTCC